MPTIKLDVPYFAWRDGRPRWVPGPKLRAAGWKGRDLKDDAGQFLPLQAALAAARELNREVAAAAGAKAPRLASARGRTVDDLIEAYLRSKSFDRLEPATKVDYVKKLRAIRYERAARGAKPTLTLFAKAPAAAIGKPEARAYFEHLDATRGLAMARGTVMALSAAYKWGTTSTDWRFRHNPCTELGLPSPRPRLRVATETEIRSLEQAAAALRLPSVADAIYLALFTGQRQGDVLALAEPFGSNRSLSERAAAGEAIRFVQGKTGARVAVFAAPQLVARLVAAEARRRALPVVPDAVVVCETTAAAYPTGDAFRRRFDKVRAAAIAGDAAAGRPACPSLVSFKFMDLRDTAVTWLALSGATVPQIASVSGQGLRGIYEIMKHYLELDETMAREAVVKLVAWIDATGVKL